MQSMHTYSTVEDTAPLWKALLPVCKPTFYSLMIDCVFISSYLNLKLRKEKRMNKLSTLDGRVMKRVSQEESREGTGFVEILCAILMFNFPLLILSKGPNAFFNQS